MLCLLGCALSVRCTPAPDSEAHTTASRDSCASCGLSQPADSGRMDAEFVEAVKRHILTKLQMRERPNITQPIPKAAMVTALRKLHAGKVREDGRVEIPDVDGHASHANDVEEETSEIITFAETGVCVCVCFQLGIYTTVLYETYLCARVIIKYFSDFGSKHSNPNSEYITCVCFTVGSV